MIDQSKEQVLLLKRITVYPRGKSFTGFQAIAFAFLLHSTGHWPAKSEIDASIIYADYYYMEALLRLKKLDEKENG